MNILWLIHGYPPVHNAGAEWMAHSMNKMLMKRGFNVRVMFQNNGHVEFQGVELGDIRNSNLRQKWVQEADFVFTHLDCQGFAFDICKEKQRQLVVVVHNTYRDELYHPRYQRNWVVINSNWIADAKKYHDFERDGQKRSMKTIVVHPPVIKEDYEVVNEPEYYTLINLNENKGGSLFYQVAKMLPDVQFLGVVGSYAKQFTDSLPNLTIMQNTSDIKTVLSRTKCLMCLSTYESFGRAGLEAMAAGIPVISTKTPGTVEAYGEAALYTERNIFAIKDAVVKMEKSHKKYAKLAEERFAEWDFEKEIDELVNWLR